MIRQIPAMDFKTIVYFRRSKKIVMAKEYTEELLIDFGVEGEKLLPVVTQDFATKEVLILSFVNREAFEETRRSGYATYWSRSRNELWKKGLTSGDLLRIEEIRINCEQNSLLFMVTPEGKGACHAKNEEGRPFSSCYYRRVTLSNKLEKI
jgi:phosphoribosyl-AMP cyclohydrolase